MLRTLLNAMLYGTKTRRSMDGGMNNSNSNLMYGFLTPGRLKEVTLNNSMFAPNSNNAYKLEAPWPPSSRLVGIDISGNIIEEQSKLTSSLNGYVFQIHEEFIHDIAKDETETASMVVSIGSSRNPQCIAAAITSESNYTAAKMITLGHDSSCTEYGELPKEGQGAKMMMLLMQKYMNEKGIDTASLDDFARKNLPIEGNNKEKKQYSESEFYFLSRGEPYYHRYGFYPEEYIESYVRAVIGMKKLSWETIRESSLNVDVVEKLESIAISCNPLLKYTDKAMQWFSAIWTKDPLYLSRNIDDIFYSIKLILKLNIGVSIPRLWTANAIEMKPSLANRVKQILASYPTEDRKLFYVQPIGRTECIEK
jgi:hypothetical protein